jgi:hypothetical protein
MSARTDAAGEPILMLDQNRTLWDHFQIRRGIQALGGLMNSVERAAFTPAGGDCRLPRTGEHGQGNRLVADINALRRARHHCALANRRT